jgi:ubiquinone/menaquinone biosynthesis C-methylase UbiE
LNRVFPQQKKSYRESPELYIKEQIKWAEVSLSFFSSEISIKDKIVLDAGCSLGGKTIYYHSLKPKKIVGLDMDSKRLSFAKKYVERTGLSVEFIEASIADMPFESDYFDLIFLNDVIEHIDNELLFYALKECKRVLKPSGKICLEFPPWESHDASHLYDYIRIPWCHLIFSDKTLHTVVNEKEKIATFGISDSWEHYTQLNRITVRQFENIIKKNGMFIYKFKRRMIKNLSFLNLIPFLNKYLTTRAIFILTK